MFWYNAATKEEHKYNTHAGIDMQHALDSDAYYQPFPFVPFKLDTPKYVYEQVVNQYKCQDEDNTLFTFNNTADLGA